MPCAPLPCLPFADTPNPCAGRHSARGRRSRWSLRPGLRRLANIRHTGSGTFPACIMHPFGESRIRCQAPDTARRIGWLRDIFRNGIGLCRGCGTFLPCAHDSCCWNGRTVHSAPRFPLCRTVSSRGRFRRCSRGQGLCICHCPARTRIL